MKKFVKSRTAKIMLSLSMFALATVPALANATSDGTNTADSAMSPAAVIGGVVLIIGLVVALAAKGSNRVPVKK